MSKNDKLYVDIHVIQTVPPSCVNRDDTGSPKQCIYGGVRRSRVSSQSWKRAVRLAFGQRILWGWWLNRSVLWIKRQMQRTRL